MDLANRFVELRKKMGLSQQELADAAGVTQASISNYESGKQIPSVNTADKIASALGVSLNELLRGA